MGVILSTRPWLARDGDSSASAENCLNPLTLSTTTADVIFGHQIKKHIPYSRLTWSVHRPWAVAHTPRLEVRPSVRTTPDVMITGFVAFRTQLHQISNVHILWILWHWSYQPAPLWTLPLTESIVFLSLRIFPHTCPVTCPVRIHFFHIKWVSQSSQETSGTLLSTCCISGSKILCDHNIQYRWGCSTLFLNLLSSERLSLSSVWIPPPPKTHFNSWISTLHPLICLLTKGQPSLRLWPLYGWINKPSPGWSWRLNVLHSYMVSYSFLPFQFGPLQKPFKPLRWKSSSSFFCSPFFPNFSHLPSTYLHPYGPQDLNSFSPHTLLSLGGKAKLCSIHKVFILVLVFWWKYCTVKCFSHC